MSVENKNILVISNDTELSKVLTGNLSSHGYTVTGTTDDGEELLETIKRISPDLVIVGMSVSCIEAVELCLRVRRWCHIPIILVKGWGISGQPGNDEESCSVGKPYALNDLMLKIETTFSNN